MPAVDGVAVVGLSMIGAPVAVANVAGATSTVIQGEAVVVAAVGEMSMRQWEQLWRHQWMRQWVQLRKLKWM